MDLRQLVAEKLTAHPGEHFLYAQYGRMPRPEPSFEAHRAAVVADMTRRHAARLKDLRTPPDPQLLTLKSWQFGFTGAEGDDDVARSLRDGVFLALQNWRRDWLSSASWRASLAAFDRPDLWISQARELERDGLLIDAGACLAAARWLDPTTAPEIAAILEARDPQLPRRLRDQPAADFPARGFANRHWHAWDMKNYGRLDLPTLLRWSCDRNFSVRARIYRSLGQRPHPAAIQALHEGTHDPHFFARAQAVRSLGWCADPTSIDHLRRLAADDPHPEVRRTAARTVERIVGFWTHYGEWNAITADPARVLATARAFADQNLKSFAWEVLVEYGEAGCGVAEIDALTESLEPHAQLAPEDHDDEHQYSHWFADARAVEAAGEPELSPDAAIAAANDPGERGFEARRVLRKLELGTLDQRHLRITTPPP